MGVFFKMLFELFIKYILEILKKLPEDVTLAEARTIIASKKFKAWYAKQ